MHDLSTSFVLGYHGCDRAVADRLLAGEPFQFERNEWDWLGHGVYFWEANPRRGLEFAREVAKQPHRSKRRITDPAVVGAVIDYGYCLDLLSSTGIQAVLLAHGSLLSASLLARQTLPENEGGFERLRRKLDCAVINHLHEIRARAKSRAFDSVRGAFMEDEPIYPSSGFRKKTHIQICVRDLSRIKGVFRVPAAQLI